MKGVLLSSLAALILAASAPVAAAASKPSDRDDDLVRRVLTGYAKCLVNSDRPRLRSMLLGDPNSGAFEHWRKGLRGECMIVSNEVVYVNPDNTTLRFALADEMLRGSRHLLTAPDVAAVPPLLQPIASARPNVRSKQGPAYDPRFAMLARFGECIVRADPAGAWALLQSRADTDAETATIQSLVKNGAACAGGSPMHIDTLSFRGSVAINYFRIAMSVRPAASRAGGGE